MTLIAEENETETLRECGLAQLVEAAKYGDREAFGELVTRFERSVFAIALRRLKNHAEAQELAQEVFVQALRKIGQVRDPRCFGGWLRSITVRLSINRLTRRAPAAATEPSTLAATCIETSTPLSRALESERQSQVRSGLDRLRPLDRETLMAFYVEGQSLVEMSNAFESPVGTIKRRLHVARKRLARELEAVM